MNANDTPPKAGERPKAKVCAICGKPRNPRYDPFCSKRCADVDLHRWLKGGYVIPGPKAGETPGEDEEE